VIKVVRSDITKLTVDAIVNAANRALVAGGGVDGAIHHAAGHELQEACDRLGGCPTGEARITPGFHLPAKYVIHTVGPVWQGGGHGEAALLESCYRQSFKLALDYDLRSIAFPSISTGMYGYPKDQAAHVAIRVMRRFDDRFDKIIACCHDHDNERIYLDLMGS
jgi:O-acetyl-ADP-ribose deacetylase (regulator of RNase III)